MVKIKLNKSIGRSIPAIKEAIANYVLFGGAKAEYVGNSDFAEFTTADLDREMLVLYNSLPEESRSIDGVEGVVEIDIDMLDEPFLDDLSVREYVRNYYTKGDKALIVIGKNDGNNCSINATTNEQLQGYVNVFKIDDTFSNFYTTDAEKLAKIAEYTALPTADEINSMLKADLKAWMVEKGLDKMMDNFDTALVAELRNFVISYYNL